MALALVATSASADLLVYEPFAYTANTALSGQNGGTGFDTGSSWATQNSGTVGNVSIKPDGQLSGVFISGTTVNPYTNTYTSFPDSGNYVGPSDGLPNNSTAPDHMSFRRTLSPAVTSTFQNGTKTYFSFTSARAMSSNARAPSLALGQGYLDVVAASDRGDTIQAGPNGKATYGVGGNTAGAGTAAGYYPGAQVNGVATSTSMVYMYLPQYWDASGTRTLGKAAGDVSGVLNISSVLGTGPLPGDHSYWMQGGGGTSSPGSLLYGYSSVNTPVAGYGDNQSKINIILGEIAWGAGTGGTDLLSYYVFHDLDALDETTYNAGKSTWDTLAVTGDRSGWNQISVAGGRYFADEIRVATTFNEALGLAPVPEPSTYVLLGVAGLGSLIAARCRRR